MPGKVKASNPSAVIPPKWKRDFVQEQAESYGFTRTKDEAGNPMLSKKMPPSEELFPDRPKRAKVIGPKGKRFDVAAVRG